MSSFKLYSVLQDMTEQKCIQGNISEGDESYWDGKERNGSQRDSTIWTMAGGKKSDRDRNKLNKFKRDGLLWNVK